MAEEATNGVQNGKSKSVTFSAVKPQLFVEAGKANDAVQFYKAAFGAEEVNRVSHPKRKAEQEVPLVISAEIKLGSSSILVSDLIDESSPNISIDFETNLHKMMDRVKTAGSGQVFSVETEDVEAAVAKAVSAGAVAVAVADAKITEGESACNEGRVSKVTDPYGIVWLFSTPAFKKSDVVDVEA